MTKHFYEEISLPKPKKGRPFVAINMVMSLDGKVTAGGKLEPGSLGGSFDRQTMNVIRSHFDAVLSGGNTVRQHPYYLGVPTELEKERTKKGLVSQPLSVVLTGSGELKSGTPLFTNPPRPPIILTTANGANNLSQAIKDIANVEILPADGGPKAICELLAKKYDVNRLLLEGGPSVNYEFYQNQLIDQVFLTLAPRFVGSKHDLSIMVGDRVLPKPARTNLLSTHQHTSELYLRYEIHWD